MPNQKLLQSCQLLVGLGLDCRLHISIVPLPRQIVLCSDARVSLVHFFHVRHHCVVQCLALQHVHSQYLIELAELIGTIDANLQIENTLLLRQLVASCLNQGYGLQVAFGPIFVATFQVLILRCLRAVFSRVDRVREAVLVRLDYVDYVLVVRRAADRDPVLGVVVVSSHQIFPKRLVRI